MRLVPLTVIVVLLLAPLAARAGAPTSDSSAAPRMLGGELLAYSFDARDLGVDFPAQVRDDSPRHADGTLFGPTGSTPGPFAAAFPADSARWVRIDDATRLAGITSDFTFATWVLLHPWCGSSPVFGAANADGTRYLNVYASCGALDIEWLDATATMQSVGAPALPWDTWHHVAFVKTGDRLSVVLDGQTVSDAPVPAGFYTGSPVASAKIAASPICCYNSGVLSGGVDDMRVYGRALGNADIQSLMAAPYAYPPHADAGGPYVATCDAAGFGHVKLDGSASSEIGGAPLAFGWSADGGLTNASAVTTNATFAYGLHHATLRVGDGEFNDSATASVTVLDGAAPVLSDVQPRADGAYAAGEYVPGAVGSGVVAIGEIDASATATDPCSGVASVTFQLDDGAPVVVTQAPYAHAFAAHGVGVEYHTLTVTAKDRAGNVAAPVRVPITLVALAPTP